MCPAALALTLNDTCRSLRLTWCGLHDDQGAP